MTRTGYVIVNGFSYRVTLGFNEHDRTIRLRKRGKEGSRIEIDLDEEMIKDLLEGKIVKLN